MTDLEKLQAQVTLLNEAGLMTAEIVRRHEDRLNEMDKRVPFKFNQPPNET